MTTTAKTKWGLDFNGNFSECKAKPQNVGKGNCKHAKHFDAADKNVAQKKAETLYLELHQAEETLKNLDSYGKARLAQASKNWAELTLLNQFRSPEIKGNLAQNKNTPDEVLRSLATSKSKPAGYFGAGTIGHFALTNPSMPADVLAKMAKSTFDPLEKGRHLFNSIQPNVEFADIRLVIAENPSTPKETLDMLAHLPWNEMKELTSKNPNAGADTLRYLFKESAGYEVKKNLLANPSTPADVLNDAFEYFDYYYGNKMNEDRYDDNLMSDVIDLIHEHNQATPELLSKTVLSANKYYLKELERFKIKEKIVDESGLEDEISRHSASYGLAGDRNHLEKWQKKLQKWKNHPLMPMKTILELAAQEADDDDNDDDLNKVNEG